MKLLSVLLIAGIGYLAGRSEWRVRPGLVLATVLLAALCHAGLGAVLPHSAIEQLASRAPSSLWLMPIAAVETAGIWLPALVVPWGSISVRAITLAYVVVAATTGALVYHEPFDAHVINGVAQGPTHPDYHVALLASLVFAAGPLACGVVVKTRRRHGGQAGPQRQPAGGA